MKDKISDPDSQDRANSYDRADNQTLVNVPHSISCVVRGLCVGRGIKERGAENCEDTSNDSDSSSTVPPSV